MAAAVAAVMVGVAGRTVTLPCRLEAANQRGVEVCWGRGQPSLFTCHNAVINSAGDQVSYRRSDRYSPGVLPVMFFTLRSRGGDDGLFCPPVGTPCPPPRP